MRCKNCGSENDSNLYICQNCGSPLYDEDEPVNNTDDSTQVFNTVGTNQAIDSFSQQPRENRNNNFAQYNQAENFSNNNNNDDDKKKKQQIILIVVLAIVLLAIIAGTIVAVVHAKKNNQLTTIPSLTITEEAETTEEPTEYTTEETTTTSTTEKTTTTTTTTKPAKVTISASYSDGGVVEGDGSYEVGETVTLIAYPDDGYEFKGWYRGSTNVGSNLTLKITARKNVKYKAVFKAVETQPEGDSDSESGEQTE